MVQKTLNGWIRRRLADCRPHAVLGLLCLGQSCRVITREPSHPYQVRSTATTTPGLGAWGRRCE